MRFNRFFWSALALLALVSCSDDKKQEIPDFPDNNGEMEVMTPEQSKQYLQDVATDLLNLFNAEDQRQAIELMTYFDETYAGLDLPEEFTDIDADPARYVKALRQALKGNVDALTRAAYTYNYTIKFNRFTGVYEPNMGREEWVKTGNSQDIIFKFTDKAGKPVELKITQSGGTSDIDFSVIDRWEDWVYNPATHNYYTEEIEETYNIYLSIPKTVNITLIDGGTQIAKSTVISSIDVNGHTISANVEASLCNLSANMTLSGTDSRVEATTLFYVNDKKVCNAYAALTGSDLCNESKWRDMMDADDDDYVDNQLARMLDRLDCGGNVLDKVQVFGQAKYYKEMSEDLDFYASCFDDDYSQTSARSECQRICDRLNNNITTQLRYNGTQTDQCSLIFVPYVDVWGSGYWECWIESNLLFPDNTTYSIDSYFNNFTNVSNKWETLIEAYEKVWDGARRR